MKHPKGQVLGIITHKQSNTQFHVKTVDLGCLHCKIRALYRKRPKSCFLKPGDLVRVSRLEGFKAQGMIYQKVILNETDLKLMGSYDQNDHDCTLLVNDDF